MAWRQALAIHGLGVLTEASRLVGLLYHRSTEMVVAIFGVIRAGGAYIPIDPDFPAARVAEILAEAGDAVRMSLLQEANFARLCPAETDAHLLLVANAQGQVRTRARGSTHDSRAPPHCTTDSWSYSCTHS